MLAYVILSSSWLSVVPLFVRGWVFSCDRINNFSKSCSQFIIFAHISIWNNWLFFPFNNCSTMDTMALLVFLAGRWSVFSTERYSGITTSENKEILYINSTTFSILIFFCRQLSCGDANVYTSLKTLECQLEKYCFLSRVLVRTRKKTQSKAHNSISEKYVFVPNSRSRAS